MSVLDGIFRRLGYTKAPQAAYPNWALADANTEQWTITADTPAMYGNQATLYQKLSWIAIAIDALAGSCAGQALNVKRMTGEDTDDIPNHDFERLIFNPNPLMSRSELVAATVSYYAISGNAYWWINSPNENTAPAELWLIPSSQIRPVPDDKLFLRGYIYDPGDGSEIPLDPWEIVHFRRFNPFSMFVGMSKIESVYMQATGDLEKIAYDRKLYGEENGRLPSVLSFADNIGNEQWEELQRQVRNRERKRQMMMLRGTGSGGVQWLQAAMSNNDMQFIQQRELTKEEIFALFAPGLSSVLAINATEANAKSGKATFSELATWPMLDVMAQKITKNLLPLYGEKLICEFDDPRDVDRQMELAEIAEYAKTHTIDEIRAKFYEDDPIGDERGSLFVVQLTAQTGKEPPRQEQLPAGQMPPEMPRQEPEETEETAEDVQSAEMEAELAKWKRKQINHFKAGKPGPAEFTSTIIPLSLQGAIAGALEIADGESAIKSVFASAFRGYP